MPVPDPADLRRELDAARTLSGRHHAGCVVIVRLDHREFGAIVKVITAVLATRPDQADWRDYIAWASRAPGGTMG